LRESGTECFFGLMEEEGEALLEPFVRWQSGPFVFFKWAQRLDGTIDGGTVSSLSSRTHVHRLRDRCDLLVIGGNTVRTDRPTLDARLVEGRAPDVLIYSANDDFDRSIPLFSVPGRNVYIDSSLERIGDYSLVMIEGGSAMLEAVQGVCDWYLCYIAPKTGGGMRGMGSVTEEFEVLRATIDDDIVLWMKNRRKKPN
jgi:diaminohydroxyphosphoribosylaminopyrimidine deaminase/5-amino-6-(5-phosphoribosylamino)uracil reductase